MNSLERVFLETISRESMFPGGSDISAAVSGGADSVAMAHLLCRFAPARSWSVKILHINHRLREEADSDQAFVEELAGRLGVPFQAVSPEPASGGSMESRWSNVRQEIYSTQHGLVAVGHNAGDRAETLLLRLVEGAGLRGLGGMDYRGVGPVRRPLLDMRREDIRKWLQDSDEEWIEDRSNDDLTIARNRIRKKVLPALTDSFPEAIEGISRSGSVLSMWRDMQDELAEMFTGDCMDRESLCMMPDVLGTVALWQLAGRPRKGFREFRKIIDWLKSGGKGSHLLPGGKRLTAGRDLVEVCERGSGRF